MTHTSNVTSNGLVAMLQVPERMIGAGISRLTEDQEIKLAEAGYPAFGVLEGFKDGLKAFGKALRTGEASDQFAKVDLPMLMPTESEFLSLHLRRFASSFPYPSFPGAAFSLLWTLGACL